MFYLLAYTFTNLGAFIVITIMATYAPDDEITGYAGLAAPPDEPLSAEVLRKPFRAAELAARVAAALGREGEHGEAARSG